jgi:hypothetical protein
LFGGVANRERHARRVADVHGTVLVDFKVSKRPWAETIFTVGVVVHLAGAAHKERLGVDVVIIEGKGLACLGRGFGSLSCLLEQFRPYHEQASVVLGRPAQPLDT